MAICRRSGGKHSIGCAAVVFALFCATFLCAPLHAELGPDDLLLVVNSRIPASRALAEMYARERHVPDGRIAEIDIPAWMNEPTEQITFDVYDTKVAQPIRDFLQKSRLTDRVKCLVTFWGVPLKIDERKLTIAEEEECAELKNQLESVRREIQGQVESLEKSVAELTPNFKPSSGTDVAALTRRFQAAINADLAAIAALQDSAARDEAAAKLTSATEALLGKPRAIQILGQPAAARVLPNPPTPSAIAAAKDAFARGDREMSDAMGYVGDSQRRKRVVQLSREWGGAMGEATILASQIESFSTDQCASALDSELALLWWHAYPRERWISNPLYRGALAAPLPPTPKTLMVTRLDGPNEMNVRRIISTSVEVEKKGLTGQVVLDARGKPVTDPYGQYDETIRSLDRLLKDHTSLQITFDNQEPIIPRHSLKDPIAVYCGWYSLHNYQPPGRFVPGAVGFHIASFEMTSLRRLDDKGWAKGLLADGVCATVGPVAEPYLNSFPRADEFFPLLLTGKLTMAEVYWRTTPLVSWRQACVADPLYTPFKTNPPLKVEDLPKGLRNAVEPETSAATRQVR